MTHIFLAIFLKVQTADRANFSTHVLSKMQSYNCTLGKKIIACQYARVSKNPALWKCIFFLSRSAVNSLKVQNLIRINKIAIL